MGMVLVLLGPPGSRKSAQAARIAEAFDLVCKSAADLLKAEKQIAKTKWMRRGTVDLTDVRADEEQLVIQVLEDCLRDEVPKASGLLLDGFPCTLHQTQALDECLGKMGFRVAGVTVLENDEEILLDNVALLPKAEQESKETTQMKIGKYLRELQPVLGHYSSNGVKVWQLQGAGGDRTDDETWQDIEIVVPTHLSEVKPRKLLQPFEPADQDKLAIDAFAGWYLDNGPHINMLFKSSGPDDSSCRTVSGEEFDAYVKDRGFDGDSSRIFRAIMAEGPMQVAHLQISLAQMRRFGRQKVVVDAAVRACSKDENVGQRFAKLLKLQHGTVLRGWRMDVDLRGMGSVDMTEFTTACQRHGLDRKASDAIWGCFRDVALNARPLLFKDLAEEENKEVDLFISCLTKKVKFDLDKTWRVLDPEERGFVSLLEFQKGAARLGFRSDAQLLFCGLDTAGLGKLWRHELDYLKVLHQPTKRHALQYQPRPSHNFRPTLRPHTNAAAAARPAFADRPGWNSQIDMTWRKNLEHSADQRSYFSDLAYKPVKEQLREKLADNAKRKAAEDQSKEDE